MRLHKISRQMQLLLRGAMRLAWAGAGLLCMLLATASWAQTGLQPLNTSLANVQAVNWAQGAPLTAQIKEAKVIRLSGGIGRTQVLQLRDDQMIQTPSGRQMSVGGYRRLLQSLEAARNPSSARAPAPFAYTKPAGGVPLPAGQTTAQLLKRPDSDVVRFPNGAVATVAQVKAMKPFVEQRYGVNLDGAPSATAQALANASSIKVSSLPSTFAELKNRPDNTVLESPKGTRVTVGDLKLALGVPAIEAAQKSRVSFRPTTPASPPSPPSPAAPQGSQRSGVKP